MSRASGAIDSRPRDVVHHEHEHVLGRADAEQPRPHRGPAVTSNPATTRTSSARSSVPATVAPAVRSSTDLGRGHDQLVPARPPVREHRAQRLVPVEDVRERRRSAASRARRSAGSRRDVVRRRGGVELVEEPHPLLRERQRDPVGRGRAPPGGVRARRRACRLDPAASAATVGASNRPRTGSSASSAALSRATTGSRPASCRRGRRSRRRRRPGRHRGRRRTRRATISSTAIGRAPGTPRAGEHRVRAAPSRSTLPPGSAATRRAPRSPTAPCSRQQRRDGSRQPRRRRRRAGRAGRT